MASAHSISCLALDHDENPGTHRRAARVFCPISTRSLLPRCPWAESPVFSSRSFSPTLFDAVSSHRQGRRSTQSHCEAVRPGLCQPLASHFPRPLRRRESYWEDFVVSHPAIRVAPLVFSHTLGECRSERERQREASGPQGAAHKHMLHTFCCCKFLYNKHDFVTISR